MTWLVTGGAGYIGAHVVREFLAAGHSVVSYDNLATGHASFLPDGVPSVHGDILDVTALAHAFEEFNVVGVVHVAGYKYAGVSVQKPLLTYQQNVTGMVNLLEAMQLSKVDKVVFSSSAATFGTPDVDIVTEHTRTAPESPYGESKLIGEWLLRDQARATGLQHTSLRYFNVVGSGTDDIVDLSPHNLFPKVFDAVIAGQRPIIFGDDYPTPDGTCVRDYIHVTDLARAHVVAAERLANGLPLEPVYNLGSGSGSSVREIISVIADVTGTIDDPEFAPRRPGDPARIVADGALAARDLGWEMRHTLQQMVASAWSARQAWQHRSSAE